MGPETTRGTCACVQGVAAWVWDECRCMGCYWTVLHLWAHSTAQRTHALAVRLPQPNTPCRFPPQVSSVTHTSCVVHKKNDLPPYGGKDEQELEASGEPRDVLEVRVGPRGTSGVESLRYVGTRGKIKPPSLT